MKKLLLTMLFASLPTICFGQHADIEFGYDDTDNPQEFELELGDTTEGFHFAESEFDGLFNDRSTQDPGFITPADEGLLVNEGDAISIKVLNARTESTLGAGYVNFYNPNSGAIEAAGGIAITNQSGDLIDANSSTIGTVESVLLSFGSDGTIESNSTDGDNFTLPPGEIHNHLTFDLDDTTAQTGAYGLLIQFESRFADASGNVDLTADPDLTSTPIWLIINNGLSEEEFEEDAVVAFGAIEAPECILGDIDMSGTVDFNDIPQFVTILLGNMFQCEADVNESGMVDFNDIPAFVEILLSE